MSNSTRYSLPAFFLTFVVFSPGVAPAADAESTLALSLGKRVDSLDWNISGGSGGPNILSELEWRDLDIFQFRAELQRTNQKGLTFRGLVDYGWVQDGVNQDSDYSGDNRTLEYSRSVNDVAGSRVWDMSGGLGTTFYPGTSNRLRIIPMVGYSYHRQLLRMTDGNQVIPASGPFPGLRSSYDTEWSGPWLGADAIWDLSNGSAFYTRLETHWVDYYARANWNLRTVANDPASALQHPISFEHWANGRGWVLELGWRSVPSGNRWEWGVGVSFQRWQTSAGRDRYYGANPAPPCNGYCYDETTLNEVNWSSRSINLSLQKSLSAKGL